MLFYFILFSIVGVVIGYLSKNKIIALVVVIAISVVWGLTHRYIWGFVSMGEMLLGYFVYMVISEK